MRPPQREIEPVSKSEFPIEDTKFRIGDEAIIMSILRDRMYSNPIRIICQEIASNARDAHREVGKETTPIQIHLPEDSDLHLRIRDFGIGISPDRMKNVFTGYGLSTKWADDDQTGTFGLGAKSPWAYSSWFEMICITYDEIEQSNVKRFYRCYIDETGIGKLSLQEETLTEEETGTEVVIPVKEGDDCSVFADEMMSVTDYWEISGGVRPEIKNRVNGHHNFNWHDFKKIVAFKDAGWAILSKKGLSPTEQDPLAIVDGIPYKIDVAALKLGDGQVNKSKNNDRIHKLKGVAVRLFFGTGEVNLAANREALDYDSKTIDIILFRFNNCLDAMTEHVTKSIDACHNLWQARVKYSEKVDALESTFPISVIAPIYWQGHKLSTGNIDVVDNYSYQGNISGRHNVAFCAAHVMQKFEDETGEERDVVILDKKARTICPQKDRYVAINDIEGKQVSKPRVLTIFKENPQLRFLYIFSLNGNNDDAFFTEADQQFGLRAMNPIYLSQVQPTRQKGISRKRGEKRERNPKSSVMVQNQHTTWHGAEVDLATHKGIYVVKHYSRLYDDFAMERSAPYDIQFFLEKYSIELYAVVVSQKGKLGPGWVRLRDFIKAKYQETLASNLDIDSKILEHQSLSSARLNFGLGLEIGKGLLALLSGSIPADHVLLRYVQAESEAKQVEAEVKAFLMLEHCSGVDRKAVSFKQSKVFKLRQEILTKYPLLELVHYDLVNDAKTNICKRISEYILAVDKGLL